MINNFAFQFRKFFEGQTYEIINKKKNLSAVTICLEQFNGKTNESYIMRKSEYELLTHNLFKHLNPNGKFKLKNVEKEFVIWHFEKLILINTIKLTL